MKKYQKTLALIVTFFVVLFAILIFFNKISTISLPPNDTNLEISNITDSSKVYLNKFGIPHIIANNEQDCFFMVGYMHARDRLFQMDIFRRTAKGELSEIFGEEKIQTDKFFKAFGFNMLSEKNYNILDKETKKILNLYSDGINYYIESNKKKLSFEFQALNYFPKKWEPVDCLNISKYLALLQSVSFSKDLINGEISERVGVSKALNLITQYPEKSIHIYNDSPFDSVKAISSSNSNYFENYKNLNLSELNKNISEIVKINKLDFSNAASNSWIVSKNKTNKSELIMASDPHLNLGLPSQWYQIHFSYPGVNVTGLSIPGIPFPFIAKNDFISWGITNSMIDDFDYYFEKVDSLNTNLYLNGNQKNKFTYKLDSIKIKGKETEKYYIRFTNRSAVISDFFEKNKNQKNANKYVYTYSWSGNYTSTEMQSMNKLIKTKEWNQFVNCFSNWSSPSLNFTYCDVSGNMGVLTAGKVPIRKLSNACIPNPGWLSDYNWVGFVPYSNMPKLYNPKKGYLVSANNGLTTSKTNFYSNYFDIPSRAERIDYLLSNQKEFSVRDIQLMQVDCYSPFAKLVCDIIKPILNNNKNKLNSEQRTVLYKFNNWDYIFSPVSPNATVFSCFYNKLLINTFSDELGINLLSRLANASNITASKITSMLQKGDSLWFNDINTPWIETKEEIVIKSFCQAVDYIFNSFRDRNIDNCKLGNFQKIEYKHILSESDFLKFTVNSGPYQASGHFSTINKSESNILELDKINYGTSSRFIVDMKENFAYSSLPGGASGDPVSPNYTDQILLFLNSGFIKLNCRNIPDPDEYLSIIFLPKK